MRNLSATLLKAQKEASRSPYVKVELSNRVSGAVRLDWTRLYTGTEEDYYHGATMPQDGSLIRVRITPLSDSRKLYRQRVADPGPTSDFSQWAYTGNYNAVVTACCSLGSEVSILWIKFTRAIYRIKSTDNGVTFGNAELVDYAPTTQINGIAAAYKPNGDMALFFADQDTLYVKQHINGQWQTKSAWDKNTGDLSGIAVLYDDDWDIMLTGKDTNNDFHLWSLVYGDGGEVSAGAWSALEDMAAAPSDGDFQYCHVFMDKPDTRRSVFVEKYTGTQTYARPFWTHSVPQSSYSDGLWREAVPLDMSAEYGLAITHHGSHCWLSSPNGVWQAELTEESLDVSEGVIKLIQRLHQDDGVAAVELTNEAGRYNTPGQGEIKALDIGCALKVSAGYITEQGAEISPGPSFIIEGYEHVTAAGRANLVISARDGWGLLATWRARHQLRWNKSSEDKCVKDLIALVLARAGIRLQIISQSATAGGFYPDFTIHPGGRGDALLAKLLSLVPDALFIEGDTAYLVNPTPQDAPVYSYGTEHPLTEGRYNTKGRGLNRAQVEGYDPVADGAVVVESFDWPQIGKLHDRMKQVEDANISTVSQAEARGAAMLRKAEIASPRGLMQAPPNCGQQLYDVIDITDPGAGLDRAARRVVGLDTAYNPHHGQYYQKISLGEV